MSIMQLWRVYITMPADNRAYLVPLHSAQIQPDGWTSDTLGTLSAIAGREKIEKI